MMYDDDREASLLDWAKLVFLVLLTLGIGFGIYKVGPCIGKALIGDDKLAPNTEEKAENQRLVNIAAAMSQAECNQVESLTKCFDAAFAVSKNALDFGEVHVRTEAGREVHDIDYNNCKAEFDANYPLLLARGHDKFTSIQGEKVSFAKFREQYIDLCKKKEEEGRKNKSKKNK